MCSSDLITTINPTYMITVFNAICLINVFIKQTYRAGCYTRHFRNCFFNSCAAGCATHAGYYILFHCCLVPSCHYYFSYSFIVNSENAFRADYTSINFTYRISFCNTFTSSSTVSSFPSRMSSATQVRM